MPWLLVGLIPAWFLAGLGRQHLLFSWLTVGLFTIGVTVLPPSWPVNLVMANDKNSLRLKVMSHNVLFYNGQTDALTTMLKTEQPDIVLLQELQPHITEAIWDDVVQFYPPGRLLCLPA